MGDQLCPRYSGTLTPTAPTAIRIWETFTFTFYKVQGKKRKSQKLFPFVTVLNAYAFNTVTKGDNFCTFLQGSLIRAFAVDTLYMNLEESTSPKLKSLARQPGLRD